MTKHFVWPLLPAGLLSGCGEVHQEHLAGPYDLSAIDIPEQRSVCYGLKDGGGVGRIDHVVGPLSETEFVRKQAELGLPPFGRTIRSLQ